MSTKDQSGFSSPEEAAAAEEFNSKQTIESKTVPEIKIGEEMTMKLLHADQEFILQVDGIPFVDREKSGLISKKSEMYDLKTNNSDVAKKIFEKITGLLKKHYRDGGSLVGYFRENFDWILKDIISEESAQ